MQSLSRIGGRYPATEGERAMLHAVREHLPEGYVSKIEGFVGYSSPALILGAHMVLLLMLGLLGMLYPKIAWLLCSLVTLSLAGEGTGRFSLLRKLFPRSASYNLVVRKKAEPSLGAVVLAAPLDVPGWRPHRRRWMSRRPFQAVFGAVLLLDVMLALRAVGLWGQATLHLYWVVLGVFAVALLGGVIVHRMGEDHDEASGPAALIELLRRVADRPVPGVDLWVTFMGCSHAFQAGMHSFLTLHRDTLPEPCLVVAIDDPANPPLRAAVSEGLLLMQHHRPTGPALVERLRWAGVVVPPVDFAGVSDARAALVRGYRALALTGGDGPTNPEAVDRAVDVLENLVRLYGEDLARVAVVRPALQELARATAEARARQKVRRRRRSRGDEETDEVPREADAS
jgi:hypothetical protein